MGRYAPLFRVVVRGLLTDDIVGQVGLQVVVWSEIVEIGETDDTE